MKSLPPRVGEKYFPTIFFSYSRKQLEKKKREKERKLEETGCPLTRKLATQYSFFFPIVCTSASSILVQAFFSSLGIKTALALCFPQIPFLTHWWISSSDEKIASGRSEHRAWANSMFSESFEIDRFSELEAKELWSFKLEYFIDFHLLWIDRQGENMTVLRIVWKVCLVESNAKANCCVKSKSVERKQCKVPSACRGRKNNEEAKVLRPAAAS